MSILQLGYGISGKESCKLAKRLGKKVYVYDEYPKLRLDPKSVDGFCDIYQDDLYKVELAVISPGIPFEKEFVQILLKNGIKVVSEIEFAYMNSKGHILAITGTNGKTTTTTLVGEILKKFTDKSYTLGNIGIPYTKYALDLDDDSYISLELSSFHLEGIDKFKPEVAAILNITEDHLYRHKTMDRYSECKFNISKNQNENDYLILNMDDQYLIKRYIEIGNVKPKVVFFTTEIHDVQLIENKVRDILVQKNKLETNGIKYVYIDQNGKIKINNLGENIEIIDSSEIKLLGRHNLQNVLAAIGVTYFDNIPLQNIQDAIREFKGVEHRIEYVLENNNIFYYNDSKGTNPDSTEKAILAMKNPIVLIAGGYDKQNSFFELSKLFKGRVIELILMGETKYKFEKDAKEAGFTNINFVENMQEAVEKANKKAEEYIKSNPNSKVDILLSPACASWGMYKNFEERGKDFKEIVKKLNSDK